MDFLTVFLIILIIVIIFLLFLLISNKPVNNYNQYKYDYNYTNDNTYNLIKNEEEIKAIIPGYENELLYENNLKSGDYSQQFTEIDFSKIPKSNNQIGFNPEPRDTSIIKLPYADINVNCLS